MMQLPMIQTNHGLLTMLAKRWDSETHSFHLSMGEMTLTLEDVWRILYISITSDLVTYDREVGEVALQWILMGSL